MSVSLLSPFMQATVLKAFESGEWTHWLGAHVVFWQLATSPRAVPWMGCWPFRPEPRAGCRQRAL